MTPTELAEFNEIRDALDIVNASQYTEGQINAMEKYLDEVRSYHSGISYAKKEGIEEGVEIGIERGVEIGIEKGLETAYKSMVNIIIDIKASVSLDQIALKYNIDFQSIVDISNSIKVGL